MPHYRATVRWSADRQRYHIEDIEAADLGAALDALRERLPADVAAAADLLEVRVQADPDSREYAPE